jgi:hypothetical protein
MFRVSRRADKDADSRPLGSVGFQELPVSSPHFLTPPSRVPSPNPAGLVGTARASGISLALLVLALGISRPAPNSGRSRQDLRQAGDQLGNPSRFVAGEPAIGDRYCAVRLAVDMREDDVVGIENPVSAGQRLD